MPNITVFNQPMSSILMTLFNVLFFKSASTVSAVSLSVRIKWLSMCLSISEVRGSFINVGLIAILESKYPRQSVIPICQPARAHTAVRITTQLVMASDRDVKWLCIHNCGSVISDTPMHPQLQINVWNACAQTHKKWGANVQKLYLSNPHRYIHKSNKLYLAGRMFFLSSSVTLRCIVFGVSGSRPTCVYSMSWLFCS